MNLYREFYEVFIYWKVENWNRNYLLMDFGEPVLNIFQMSKSH